MSKKRETWTTFHKQDLDDLNEKRDTKVVFVQSKMDNETCELVGWRESGKVPKPKRR